MATHQILDKIGAVQPQNCDKRLHIMSFTSSLGRGGAEMHLLRVLNHLDRQRFTLSLALARKGGSYEPELNQDVKVHFLETGNIVSSTLQMVRAIAPLRQLIQAEQPDVVCSVMRHANIATLLATYNLPNKPKLVLSLQNPPSILSKNVVLQWLMRSLMPHLYPQADQIIALSQGVADDLQTLVPTVGDRTKVIYNAGVDHRVMKDAAQALPEQVAIDRPLIVTCGRLVGQKGFLYLIEALAKVRQSIPAHLWIIGEGPQRPMLERKIRKLGLTPHIKLLGFQQNPYQYMAAADVFVSSSIYEGFGNVIVEAMACGVPVIATDCPSGPREIINNEINGLLVETANPEALATAIIRLLKNPELKQRLANAGQARAQDFHSQAIASAYGQLFLEVAKPHRN